MTKWGVLAVQATAFFIVAAFGLYLTFKRPRNGASDSAQHDQSGR